MDEYQEYPKEALIYWNYVTGGIDRRDSIPTDWTPYIPQTPEVQARYAADLRAGKTPRESANDILRMFFAKEQERVA